jgi:hypothetical protein
MPGASQRYAMTEAARDVRHMTSPADFMHCSSRLE